MWVVAGTTGYFSSNLAALSCVACPQGSYSDTGGAASCLACPFGTTTAAPTGEEGVGARACAASAA